MSQAKESNAPQPSSESFPSLAPRAVRRLKRQVALAHERPVQERAAQMRALLGIEAALKEDRFTVELADRIWKHTLPPNRRPKIPRGEVDMVQQETATLYAQIEAARGDDRLPAPAQLRAFWKGQHVAADILAWLRVAAPAWLDTGAPPLGLSRDSCVTLLDTLAVRRRQRLPLTRFRVLALLAVFPDDMDDSTAERHAARWRREEGRRLERARAQATERFVHGPEVVLRCDEPPPTPQGQEMTPQDPAET